MLSAWQLLLILLTEPSLFSVSSSLLPVRIPFSFQSDEAWRRSQGISPLSDNDYITVEEVVEDVIDVQEEVVQDEE